MGNNEVGKKESACFRTQAVAGHHSFTADASRKPETAGISWPQGPALLSLKHPGMPSKQIDKLKKLNNISLYTTKFIHGWRPGNRRSRIRTCRTFQD
jgi:hypothetical protein